MPAVDRVLDALGSDVQPLASDAARRSVDAARERVLAGGDPASFEEIVTAARTLLESGDRSLRRVVNATGVLIHTNLGRAPLGADQLEAARRVSTGYSNLEFDLVHGERGDRYAHAGDLLRVVTGAEAGLVVNNNAAAVLLVLVALSPGSEVVISRGELIEIGGEFRIPEMMEISTAQLVEVGTTNRTRIADYERAIGSSTGAILKVHPSNYRVVGFTEEVDAAALARLARGRGIPFVYDVGSGLLDAAPVADWARDEPVVNAALTAGADLVTFSADKLLGGPQAGVIVGRKELIDRLTRHPLLRALRVDKMTIAALQETLRAFVQGRVTALPLWQLATASVDELERRARMVAEGITRAAFGLEIGVIRSASVMGGGSLPGAEIESRAVAIASSSAGPSEIRSCLRRHETPVVARIDDDRVILDLRSVFPHEDDVLVAAVSALF